MISKIFQYIAITAMGIFMSGMMSPAEAKTVRVQVDDGTKAAAKKAKEPKLVRVKVDDGSKAAAAKKATAKKAEAKRKAPKWVKYKHLSSSVEKGSTYVVRVVIRFTNDSADRKIHAFYDKNFKLKLTSKKSGATTGVVFSEKIWDEITLKPGETVDIRYGVKLSSQSLKEWVNKYKNEGFNVSAYFVDCQVKHDSL